jgi:hypothetical protein
MTDGSRGNGSTASRGNSSCGQMSIHPLFWRNRIGMDLLTQLAFLTLTAISVIPTVVFRMIVIAMVTIMATVMVIVVVIPIVKSRNIVFLRREILIAGPLKELILTTVFVIVFFSGTITQGLVRVTVSRTTTGGFV